MYAAFTGDDMDSESCVFDLCSFDCVCFVFTSGRGIVRFMFESTLLILENDY